MESSLKSLRKTERQAGRRMVDGTHTSLVAVNDITVPHIVSASPAAAGQPSHLRVTHGYATVGSIFFRRSLPASTSRGLDFLGQTVPLRSATELHVSERSRDYSTQFPSASEQVFVQHTCARLRQQGPFYWAAHAGSYGHIAVPDLRRDASHTARVLVIARRVKAGLSADQMACAFPIDRRANTRS